MRLVPTWADAPVDRNKFDRNAVEIPRYADIEKQFSRDTQRIILDLERGNLSEVDAIALFRNRLKDAETQAFAAGRRARGVADLNISESEAAMLAGRHSRNMRYFHQFVRDVAAGAGRMSYAKRADLYAKSLWSLYTRAESVNWDDPELNARYYWIMDPASEHCPTCLERAKMSRRQDGFTYDELTEIGFPGENTDCQVRCRCHIRVVKKKLLLPERIEDLTPAKTGDEGLSKFKELMGGDDMPIKLPAAGLPYVKVTPEVITQSIAAGNNYGGGYGAYSELLAQLLPMLPVLLTKPADKIVYDDDVAVFTGYGLDAKLTRVEGIYELTQLILSGMKPSDYLKVNLK